MNFVQLPLVRLFFLTMLVISFPSFSLAEKSFGSFLDVSAHEAPIYALAFSPDGTKLVSAGADQSVAIWNTDTWALSLRIENDSGAIHVLSFSPDGSILAAGSDDGTVHLWNTTTWSNPKIISAHARDVRAIAFSKDGKRLVTAGRDRKSQPTGLLGKARSLIYIDKTDDVIKIWNTSQWSLLRTLPPLKSRVETLSFSSTKGLLASGEKNGEVVILNTETWQAIKRLQFQHAPLKTLTFNKNGTCLLGGGEKQGLTVWKTADWTLIEDKALKLQAITYNPTENQIAVGGRNGKTILFSNVGAKTLEAVQKNLEFNESVNVIRFSPDGQVLVIGSNDGTIKVGQPLLPIPLPKSLVAPNMNISVPLIVANFDPLLPIPTPVLSVTPNVTVPTPLVVAHFDPPLSTVDVIIVIGVVGILLSPLAFRLWRRRAGKRKAAKLEAAKIEAEEREIARLEAEGQIMLLREAERRETARHEAENQEKARLEAERIRAARAEAERAEATKREVARVEAEHRRREAVRVEAERAEIERQNATRYNSENKARGYVYLLKAGPYYKIGKSKDADKRVKQIRLQLPYPVEKMHEVLTDNMAELENSWHRRFKKQRANGEWFILSDSDVEEFIAQPSLSKIR